MPRPESYTGGVTRKTWTISGCFPHWDFSRLLWWQLPQSRESKQDPLLPAPTPVSHQWHPRVSQ